MITTGETTAEAPRPLLGTTEKAIPSAVEVAVPNRISHAKVNHLDVEVGILRPKNKTPPANSRMT